MVYKMLLLTLLLWLSVLCCSCSGKPHLLAAAPVGYATAGGAWLTAPTVAATAAYYPYTYRYPGYVAYTPLYYNSYASYPYYGYLRR